MSDFADVAENLLYTIQDHGQLINELEALHHERVAELKAERDRMADALQDCASALRYIRETHGELYGVGFDRALGKADSIAGEESK